MKTQNFNEQKRSPKTFWVQSKAAWVKSAALFLIVPLMSVAKADSPTDPFDVYLKQGAPKILREIPVEGNIPSDIKLKRVVFESRVVESPNGPMTNEVYAIIASPAKEGTYPGLMVMHGGKGNAEYNAAIAWAKRGYIVVAHEQPGIADPEKSTHSKGYWVTRPYGSDRWIVKPDVTSNRIFDAGVGAIQAFRLLQAQPGVDKQNLGVVGISWGGYMTTMLSSLVGDEMKAAFAVYGCGYYEKAVFGEQISKGLPSPDDQEKWYSVLDCGRRAKNIKAKFFFSAASNDSFFYPPAILATYNDITGEKNIVVAPNADHKTAYPGGELPKKDGAWAAQEVEFFDYYLKGQGQPFPVITVTQAQPDEKREVKFSINSPTPIQKVEIYATTDSVPWNKKKWVSSPATSTDGKNYTAVLPESAVKEGMWFAFATDNRPVSVSSVYQEYKEK